MDSRHICYAFSLFSLLLFFLFWCDFETNFYEFDLPFYSLFHMFQEIMWKKNLEDYFTTHTNTTLISHCQIRTDDWMKKNSLSLHWIVVKPILTTHVIESNVLKFFKRANRWQHMDMFNKNSFWRMDLFFISFFRWKLLLFFLLNI